MTIGYDNWRLNQYMLLDLQFRETTGTVTRDWAKPYHDPATLTGAPTWAVLGSDLTYLSFNLANPDRIVILAADCTDIEFTSGSFSGAMWVYPDAYGNRYFYDKSSATAGWSFWVAGVSPYLAFTTANAGPATQTTYGGPGLQLSAWQFIGFTRTGADANVYLDGRDVTTVPAAHIDPGTQTAIDLYIGTIVGAGAGWYDGRMWRPRIWNMALEAWEMQAIYEAERDLFGV